MTETLAVHLGSREGDLYRDFDPEVEDEEELQLHPDVPSAATTALQAPPSITVGSAAWHRQLGSIPTW